MKWACHRLNALALLAEYANELCLTPILLENESFEHGLYVVLLEFENRLDEEREIMKQFEFTDEEAEAAMDADHNELIIREFEETYSCEFGSPECIEVFSRLSLQRNQSQ